ncbi:hypothetical protein DRQ50_13550 [bacterium]|nr:MAG: hypothetical protein DRQ50_13550 [bacterium]
MNRLSIPALLTLTLTLTLPATTSLAGDTGLDDLPGDLLEDLGALPSTENAWWLLGGTALTIIAHELEDPAGARRALDDNFLDPIVDFGNIWGDARVQVPLALGTWIYGGLADNDEVGGLGYDLSRSLLLTYSFTGVIKHTVNRTRPNGDDLSFPSGHTAAAFSTAGVVTRRYGGWAGGITVGLGVLTALGRMEDMKHYASDVVAGATIGWIIGRTVARDGRRDENAWRLVPTMGGLTVVGRF